MNITDSQTSPIALDDFGRRVAARLTDSSAQLPYDIAERLRAARVQAVEKRKQMMWQAAPAVFNNNSGALTLGHGAGPAHWWQRLGALGLLLVLVCGLYAISAIQDELGARELADIDSAILTDDLPPAAYTDAGFTQFLKITGHQD